MIKWLAIAGVLLACASTAPAAETEPYNDPVFDVKALTATPLEPKVLKTTEKEGIVTEEVQFHSEMDGQKSVDIFAFFSYPKGATKLPAFIWNQAGLGQASTYFTELGAKRGYAALCIDLPLAGYRSTGGYQIGGLDVGADPHQAPIYHCAVALLKAVSYLESRPEVDKDRIGMAGSSWGGFFTTLMIGIDPRLKVGSAMFGTGNLQMGSNWPIPEENRENWQTTLDPAWRLQYSKTPIGWFTGTQDFAYWMPSVMATYEMAAGEKHLTLQPNWDHGLPPYLDEQVFVWLDAHLKGAPAFIKVTPLKVSKQGNDLIAQWSFSGPRKAESAELILSYGDAGNWQNRYWITLKADIKDSTCTAKLPAGMWPYYIGGAVTDGDKLRYSTPLLRVRPKDFGVKFPNHLLDYNGASMWGDFEEDQVKGYLDPNGWAHPPVGTDAHTGKQSAILTAGKTSLPRLYFPVGIVQVFTAFLKADKPTEVTVELSGKFAGEVKSEQKTFQIGTEWTEISLPFAPPAARSANLGVAITVPEGRNVLVDSVSFSPGNF